MKIDMLKKNRYLDHYNWTGSSCWSGCGEQVVNYTHTFFTFPISKPFSEEVGKTLKNIFDLKGPLKIKYSGY